MANEYEGSIEYRWSSWGGNWASSLRRNGGTIDTHRSYTRFGGRIWLTWAAITDRISIKLRDRNEKRSKTGIKL